MRLQDNDAEAWQLTFFESGTRRSAADVAYGIVFSSSGIVSEAAPIRSTSERVSAPAPTVGATTSSSSTSSAWALVNFLPQLIPPNSSQLAAAAAAEAAMVAVVRPAERGGRCRGARAGCGAACSGRATALRARRRDARTSSAARQPSRA